MEGRKATEAIYLQKQKRGAHEIIKIEDRDVEGGKIVIGLSLRGAREI